MPQSSQPVTAASLSPWRTLRHGTFRYLWLATLASNIGTWMHDTGAGWLAASLTDSAFMVALMQSATSLPAFFLLLPSGALADILDRRKYLLYANVGMAIVAAALGLLTLTGSITVGGLLLLTLLLGIGSAMRMPAWQSIIPEVVPRSDLPGAIALNTAGMNAARVLGALIAGVIIAASGPGAVFVCNALSFIIIIWVLLCWKRQAPETNLPPERFSAAVKTGLRYTRHSPALRATIYRSIGFYFFASVMWALFPLIARELLDADEIRYGILFAAISAGAIANALLLPRLRARYDNDQLITGASMLFAAGIIITAALQNYEVALLALALCGAAWITVMTCAQTSAQTALPDWVRSRGLSVFLAIFMGSMAIGPAVWGVLAQFTSIPAAMIAASLGLALAALVTRRWPVSGNDYLDHRPSRHWKIPRPLLEIQPGQGPVMVSIRYRVQKELRTEFLQLMAQLEKARRRDGASQWEILEDAQAPGTFCEFFMVDSWLDRLRQHERISKQDAMIQERIRVVLAKGTRPEISHHIKPGAAPPASSGETPRSGKTS